MKSLFLLLATLHISAGILFSQQLVTNFGNNNVATTSISFTPDGRYMFIGGFAKSYDLANGIINMRTLKKDTETNADLAFKVEVSKDNRFLVISKLNRLEIWDIQSNTMTKAIRDMQLIEPAVCITSDSKYIVCMHRKGEIVFRNAVSFKISHEQNLTSGTPTYLTASPDGKKMLIGTKAGSIITFDINTREINAVKVAGKEIQNITMPESCEYVAASSSDGRIWLGSYPDLKPVRSWQAHSSGLTSIAFHPSGEYLASGGKDKLIRIWEIPEGIKKEEWEAHRNPVHSVAFSPNGAFLASGSDNDAFSRSDDTRLWSFSAGEKMAAVTTQNTSTSKPASISTGQLRPDADSQKRLALVIGNGNYLGSTLANPENDARAMRDVLLQFGFDVLEYENLTQSQMKKAMDEFGEKLKNYDAGLFFYAGHGIQSNGYNYLIPVDASLKSEEQVEYDCVQADRILALMEGSGSKVNIIILDACRNNPFERSWTRSATGKGLAFMNAPSGSLIAYATAPGSTASDGAGGNGLYTSAILESIRIPDINILQIFQNVRSIVSGKSEGKQIPWESTSLTGDFYF